MNANELLRIVDAIHRDKNIEQEIVFEGIEAALVSAAKKHYGEEADIIVQIDRTTGAIDATCDGEVLDSEETVGRIGAQTAKQVMIQKIREAERDALYDEYSDLVGEMVSGIVQRYEGGAATVALTNVEAILPRSEQIPGESHHVNERVRGTVFEVRKSGSRVKVILSRTRPQLIQRLFEQEIPEIIDGVIEVRSMSREPGYRSKVAVSSSDQRVDCVGACVGVRGNRIKNIVDELGGERIDIVRWDDNLEVLIPNALQPAEVEQVILCKMLGRAIVLVREDQLSLAIGRRGQNVRLASKLSGWDIEIMTQEELAESIDRAVNGFSSLEGVAVELAERLVEEGFLSYDDLSVIEPDALMKMGGLVAEEVDRVVEQAEVKAEEAEKAAAEARIAKRSADRLAAERERELAAAEQQAAEETSIAGDESPVDTTQSPENSQDDGAAEVAPESTDEVLSATTTEEGLPAQTTNTGADATAEDAPATNETTVVPDTEEQAAQPATENKTES
ncbi:MAG: transcription termination factor NusA [Pirellulales bacterium]|nr:transcription termination factor NusA [Pirellulales bacterium]